MALPFLWPQPPILAFSRYNKRMESDGYYLGLALEQAREGLAAREVPVGAVLVDEAGEVLARAFNRPIALHDPTAHAEVLVLREGARLRGNYRLPGLCLYVTMEPCIMCLGATIQARLRRLVLEVRTPRRRLCVAFSVARGCPPQSSPGSDGRGPEAECRALMQEFFKARR